MQLTFEQLPDAVARLFLKLESIEKLLLEKNKSTTTESEDLFTIKEAAEFIRLSTATIYGLVSRSEIPCMKKGKRLYFSKAELIEWIKTGRKQTNLEIESETDFHLINIKKRRIAA